MFLCKLILAAITILSLSAHPKTLLFPNPQHTERILLSQPIKSMMPMKTFLAQKGLKSDFYNPVFLVTLTNGTKAVFKPDTKKLDMYGELVTYKASQWMGVSYVPPTVLRKIQGQWGSLQLYIEHLGINEEQFRNDPRK